MEGVILVDKFTPSLGDRLAASATRRLDRRVLVDLAQVKRQTNAAEEYEDQLNRRVSALEQRDADVEALLSALTVGGLIGREELLIDVQAKRVLILRDRDAEADEVGEARDRIITETRIRYPGWLLREGIIDQP